MENLEEIRVLIEGIKRFSSSKPDWYNTTVEDGQQPKVLVIGCADSMVDPAILMGAGPGQLFVHRNVAALVPPYERETESDYHATSAVLQHAVMNLKVNHVIILSHGYCGGVATLMQGPSEGCYISKWMDIGASAKTKVLESHSSEDFRTQCHHCERATAVQSLHNLETFPFVKAAVEERGLALHAWHFDRGAFAIYNGSSWESIISH